ncbi:MAG: hypothetical protein F6J86_26890 [Symploca sp. SIO1B1]|nr:hypothetical protein [Symploca sp. SIO1B1]
MAKITISDELRAALIKEGESIGCTNLSTLIWLLIYRVREREPTEALASRPSDPVKPKCESGEATIGVEPWSPTAPTFAIAPVSNSLPSESGGHSRPIGLRANDPLDSIDFSGWE